ncbi:hypothetical protein M405DRAFT_842698 [Rhizopogon salebrosus TDB-379]|nr:hypothetical protein M405DRAFT_842698 [Rhizopogon salebrosus TDB-379]
METVIPYFFCFVLWGVCCGILTLLLCAQSAQARRSVSAKSRLSRRTRERFYGICMLLHAAAVLLCYFIPDDSTVRTIWAKMETGARAADNTKASDGGISRPTNGVTTVNGSEPKMIKANKGGLGRSHVLFLLESFLFPSSTTTFGLARFFDIEI